MIKVIKNHLSLFFVFSVIGCTLQDVIPTENNTSNREISFSVTDVETKGLDVTTANLTSFVATAYNAGSTSSPYFSNTTFTGSGSPKIFTASGDLVWPDNSLDFYAYSVGSATGQVAITNYKTFTITPSDTPSSQVDFVYACAKNQSMAATEGVVPLTFQHALSKVRLKISNSNTVYRFEVSGWKIGYVDKSATFTHNGISTENNTISSACWSQNTSPSPANTYTIDFSDNPISVAINTNTTISLPNEMTIIPQNTTGASGYASSVKNAPINGSYIGLRLKVFNAYTNIQKFGGDEGEWAVWPTSFDWEPGQIYSYVIDLNDVETQACYETNPVSNGNELWNIMKQLPEALPTFAGLMIAPGNAGTKIVDGIGYYVIQNDWNKDSYNKIYRLANGSYYVDWLYTDISALPYKGYSDWRLPTQAEWAAVTTGARTGSTINGTSGCRYALVRLTGITHAGVVSGAIYGLLLAPDGITMTDMSATFLWNQNSALGISKDLLNEYLSAGCVFLPASGFYYNGYWRLGGEYGTYWSSTPDGNNAYCLTFGQTQLLPNSLRGKADCLSVRLVRSAE